MDETPMILALDAMGGDLAPGNPVKAAVDWIAENQGKILLVGREESVQAELDKHRHDRKRIEIVHAEETVLMTDNIDQALRRKKKSSLRIGFELVNKNEALGFVSAGHSGAMMALSKLVLKMIERIERPCIAAMYPTKKKDKKVLVADSGGNTECSPKHLLDFAVCCVVYLESMHDVANPGIGLLNVGSEPGKGNDLTREAYKLFSKSNLNFVGNIEGKEFLDGNVDVVVCDGFVGNVLLKSAQGVFSYIKHSFLAEMNQGWINRFSLILLRPTLKRIFSVNNYETYGGALLLGVDGVSVVSHGNSTPLALKSALSYAKWGAEARIHERIRAKLEKLRVA